MHTTYHSPTYSTPLNVLSSWEWASAWARAEVQKLKRPRQHETAETTTPTACLRTPLVHATSLSQLVQHLVEDRLLLLYTLIECKILFLKNKSVTTQQELKHACLILRPPLFALSVFEHREGEWEDTRKELHTGGDKPWTHFQWSWRKKSLSYILTCTFSW